MLFPLELELRAWLLVTNQGVFFSMSMTKRPGHNLRGKESEDHNLKK